MTKIIKTISDLTEALVMAGHERVDGESFLYPPEGLKPFEYRWSCFPQKGMVAIAMAVPVFGEEVVPAFLICETGDDNRTLTILSVSSDIYRWHDWAFVNCEWLKGPLGLLLEFAAVVRKHQFLHECFKAYEREPEPAD